MTGVHPLLEKVRRGESLTREELDTLDDVEVLKAILAEMLKRDAARDKPPTQ